MGWKGDWRKREVEKAKGRERETEPETEFLLFFSLSCGPSRIRASGFG